MPGRLVQLCNLFAHAIDVLCRGQEIGSASRARFCLIYTLSPSSSSQHTPATAAPARLPAGFTTSEAFCRCVLWPARKQLEGLEKSFEGSRQQQ